MKQLGILDAAFINLEHPNTPQHIGGFGIYDPSTAPGGFVRFKQVIANFEQRLKKMPVFRTRLVEVPLGLDRPYWVIDEHFDVEFHLRHIALPKPGDWRQLCIQIARLHARPLDMTRPLWECYIIEGLDNIDGIPDGAFAIYTKMHHSLIDGAGSQAFMAALHDLEPQPGDGEPQRVVDNAEHPFVADVLSTAELLRKAVVSNTLGNLELARQAVGVAGDVLRLALAIQTDKLAPPPLDAPKTRFDQPVGPHRVFDAALFDLDDFKMIRHATGTTVNDVAVAVISGALRRYLQHHGELPDASMASCMPVNMRARQRESSENNQVCSIMSLIHTHIADPVLRLQMVGHSLSDAKAYIGTPLADPLRLAGVFKPWLSRRVSKWYGDRRITRHLPMGSGSVITNVMGPPFPLYCAGAKMVQYYCLGLLTPGGGLFHAVFSMIGQLSISVLADRNQMPDPEFYTQCLQDSFAELKQAVIDRNTPVLNPPPQPRRRRVKPVSAAPSLVTDEPAAAVAATKRTRGKGAGARHKTNGANGTLKSVAVKRRVARKNATITVRLADPQKSIFDDPLN